MLVERILLTFSVADHYLNSSLFFRTSSTPSAQTNLHSTTCALLSNYSLEVKEEGRAGVLSHIFSFQTNYNLHLSICLWVYNTGNGIKPPPALLHSALIIVSCTFYLPWEVSTLFYYSIQCKQNE